MISKRLNLLNKAQFRINQPSAKRAHGLLRRQSVRRFLHEGRDRKAPRRDKCRLGCDGAQARQHSLARVHGHKLFDDLQLRSAQSIARQNDQVFFSRWKEVKLGAPGRAWDE